MAQPRVTPQTQVPVNDDEQTGKSPDTKLYEELGELARFIDTTMKTLSEFSTPVSTSTEQLPQALSHLTNLKTMTEQGTHRVMLEVEAIQDNHLKLSGMIKDLTLAMQKAQTAPALLQQVQAIGTAINAVAAALFIATNKVFWPYAMAMMATSLCGGFVAAHFSRQVKSQYIRYLVCGIGFALAAWYFLKN